MQFEEHEWCNIPCGCGKSLRRVGEFVIVICRNGDHRALCLPSTRRGWISRNGFTKRTGGNMWESDDSVIPDDSRCLIKTGLSEKPFGGQMFCGWTPTLVKTHFWDVGRPRSWNKWLKWSPQRSSYVQWTKHLLVIPCMLPVVMFLSRLFQNGDHNHIISIFDHGNQPWCHVTCHIDGCSPPKKEEKRKYNPSKVVLNLQYLYLFCHVSWGL